MRSIPRRRFLQVMGAGAAAVALPGVFPNADRRPNIILIMADDMGFSDLGCYGSEIETPHLDGLARGGIRFTEFYNTSRCCPTRASIMTGLYQHQTGIGHMMSDYGMPGYRGDLNRRCVTIPEVLKPAGYTTLMSGKWHVTPVSESQHNWPRQRGFDHFFGTIQGAGSYFDPGSLARDNQYIEPGAEDFYYTTAIGENAVKYIETYGGKGNPFFLYVPFTSPHWPLHAREKDIAKYKGRYDGGWDRLRVERHRRMIEMGLVKEHWPLTPRDERAPAWKDAEHKRWQARRMEVYAAQVDSLDQAVGRIVDTLHRLGFEENTLILFLSDNGGCAEELRVHREWPGGRAYPRKTRDGRPMQWGNDPTVMPGPENTFQSYGLAWGNAGNTPFRLYKKWVHEGGIATPLIAHWPARIKQAGILTHQPGHVMDIMATCKEVAGAEYPKTYQGHEIKPLEGRSLAPIFSGRRREDHEAIYWEHMGNRAVRRGKWKLVSENRKVTGGVWELYDLEADRTEMNNLAEKFPQKVAELDQMYANWIKRCDVVPGWFKLRDS